MTKNKQILFVHQNFPGQFRYLAPALIKKGFEVHAIGQEDNITQVDKFPGLNLHYYQIKKGSNPDIDSMAIEFEAKMLRARFAADKCKELKNNGLSPSLVIAHPQWGESFLLKDIWPEAKLLSYFEMHWHTENSDIDFDDEFYNEEYFENTVRKIRARNVYNYAIYDQSDKIICPTEYQKSTAPDNIKKNIKVIHDGINTDALIPNSEIEIKLDNGLRLTKKNKVITFINRNFEPQRGYHVFMRSLPDIFKKHKDATVLMIGGEGKGYGLPPPKNDSWRNIFFNEVKDKIDPSRVHFLGIVDYRALVNLFQISTVHVYLTYPFVLSWSLLEAMSCGCLILGSKTLPVEEVITNNKNGLLVDFFDTKEIAEIVNNVLENPSKYEKLRTAARNTIIEKYDLNKKCLPQQIKLINSMLG